MLVYYAKPNCLTMMVTVEQAQKLNSFGVSHETGVKFIPGINEVHSKVWETLAALPKVKRLIKSKEIKITANVDGTDEKPVLAAMKPEDAAAAIKKTFNRPLLESWLAGESRPKVTAAITEQIKMIMNQTSKKKSDDDEEEAA